MIEDIIVDTPTTQAPVGDARALFTVKANGSGNAQPADAGEQSCAVQLSAGGLSEDDRLRQGREVRARLGLDRRQEFTDWLAYGEGWAIGQAFAEREAGAAKGHKYNKAINAWWRRHDYGRLDKTVRSRLLECVKHRDEILRWLADPKEPKRARLNHPVRVLRAWQRATGQLPLLAPRAQQRSDTERLPEILAAHSLEMILQELGAARRDELQERLARQTDALTLQRTSCKALTKVLIKIIGAAAKGDVADIIGAATEITNKVTAEGRELKDIAVYFHRTAQRRCGKDA
jgi:hypothetical protein